MQTFTYRRGAESPGLVLPWQYESAQGTWTDLDLSSGYTFTLTLVANDGTTTVTKTTGIAGTNGTVEVSWSTDELNIAPGNYTLNLRATAGGLDRDYSPARPIKIQITA